MKKKFILCFIFLICFFAFLNCYKTQAASISDFETITKEEVELVNSTEEEKILKYDAKTNTTTEVDMDEIKQILNSKSTRSYNDSTTSSYIPNEKLIDRSSMLSPRSTYMRIDNTSVFPYSTIGKITCSGGSGSGTIIGKNIAITVAHVVMDDNCNFYTDWKIMPAYNNRYL